MSWSSLLSGALGGVLVLACDVLVRRIEDKRQQRKELISLLRALYFEEIVPTAAIARRLEEDPSAMRSEILPTLGQDVWAASRFRIAELADVELFGSLVKYYAYLRTLSLYIDINEDKRKREEYGLPMAARMRSRREELAGRIEPLIDTASRPRGGGTRDTGEGGTIAGG